MSREFTMSYETVGTASYMAVALQPEAQLVHYQLEMMVDNAIGGLLPVFKRVINGETVIYYNITSLIPLSQILEKRKLTRKEFLNLIEGAVLAVREAAAYRLPESGLVMDISCIYVNPSSCKPGFLYLPLMNQENTGLRELIQELVMKGRLELSSDNFVQVLLDVLNEEVFSIEHLEACVKRFSSAAGERRQEDIKKEMKMPQEPVRRQTEYKVPEPVNQPVHAVEGIREPEGKAGVPEQAAVPDKADIPVKKAFPGKRKTKASKEKPVKEPKDEASEKAKKKFLLPQAVIMIALAAAVSFGLFVDEAGAIVVNNVLAAVILVALVEVILYREAYINGDKSDEPKKGKTKKAAKNKAEKKKSAPLPEMPGSRNFVPGRPAVTPEPPVRPKPVRTPEQAVRPAPVITPEQNVGPNPVITSEPVVRSRQAAAPEPVIMPGRGMEPQMERQPGRFPDIPAAFEPDDTEMGSETELWDGADGADENRQAAYLEYFENGNLIRIPLSNPGGVIIGRLRSEVDFAVSNTRVGKVHARFFEQNGHYFVVDINSKNGTFINGSGKRINSNVPYPLQDNDRIMLADSEFTIRCPQ